MTDDLGPLAKAAAGMKRIVEEIDGAMNHGTWRDERGMRLKDTPEWVALYNAISDHPAAPAPVVPADQRAAIEALADRMWRVHPKDIHAAGYEHLERGGKYENPRAAWYADQIEALFKQFRDQVSPVVPAEGLVAAMREAIDLLTECKQGSSARSPGHNARLVLESALRSAPPVGARVAGWQPIETAPKDGVTEVLMYDPDLGMAVWPSTNSPWPNVTHWMPLPEPPAALLPAGEGE